MRHRTCAEFDRARYGKLDVTKEKEWDRAVALAVTDFGKLDVLVNNAGMIIYHPLAETPPADFIRQFEIDQLGVFLGLRAAYPALKRSCYTSFSIMRPQNGNEWFEAKTQFAVLFGDRFTV